MWVWHSPLKYTNSARHIWTSKLDRIYGRGEKKVREYPAQLLVNAGLWVLNWKLNLLEMSCRSWLVKRLWEFLRCQALAYRPKGIILHLLKVKETVIHRSNCWSGRRIYVFGHMGVHVYVCMEPARSLLVIYWVMHSFSRSSFNGKVQTNAITM